MDWGQSNSRNLSSILGCLPLLTGPAINMTGLPTLLPHVSKTLTQKNLIGPASFSQMSFSGPVVCDQGFTVHDLNMVLEAHYLSSGQIVLSK